MMVSIRLTSFALGFLALPFFPLSAQPTGTVSGVVIDQQSARPVADVSVGIEAANLTTLTGSDGRFRISEVPVGERSLVLQHIAYGMHTRPVQVAAGADLQLRVQISPQAIELTPLVVQVMSDLTLRNLASGNRVNQLERADIEEAARAGLRLSDLIRRGMQGIRIRRTATGDCVEYRGSEGGAVCKGVAVFIDGVQIASSEHLFAAIPLDDIQRVELLSPGQAGARYGSFAGWGVLLIETQQGLTRDERGPERLAPGFDWSLETEPYRWKRVLGSAFVANGVGVGLGLLALDMCLHIANGDLLRVRSECGGVGMVASGFLTLGLPGTAGSLVTSRAGSTNRSRGMLLPSAVLATLTVSGGYLLLFHAETQESNWARVGGIATLAVGAPLTMAISDRLFRKLR
jgi:hypothetical protein